MCVGGMEDGDEGEDGDGDEDGGGNGRKEGRRSRSRRRRRRKPTHKQAATKITTSNRSNSNTRGSRIHHAKITKKGIQKRTNWTERSIASARAGRSSS